MDTTITPASSLPADSLLAVNTDLTAYTLAQQAVLRHLTRSGASQFTLASRTGYPEATIRRTIQELRDYGFNIPNARDHQGLYRLFSA